MTVVKFKSLNQSANQPTNQPVVVLPIMIMNSEHPTPTSM